MKINKWVSCFITSAILTVSNSQAFELGDANCDSLLLVSSYEQNDVKVFDGCTGDFIKNIDENGLISGAQAIVELADGRILIASEKNNRLVAVDSETLSHGEIVADSTTENFIQTPLGLAIDDDNILYVASYSQNKIIKIDSQTWQVTETFLPSNNSIITGIDAGTIIDNGYLYAPGYDSNNVIRVNLLTNEFTLLVSNGANGLNHARGLAINNEELFVTSEGTNEIKVFNKNNGEFIRSMSVNSAPAGIQIDGENHLIYNNRRGVYRITLTGEDNIRIITPEPSTVLSGATFVYRLKKNMDSDGDGLTDQQENDVYGTDPNKADSDDDGMPDGWEVQHNLDPLVDDAMNDADEDGLSNVLEYQAQTDPNDQDTDNDGLNDFEDENPLIPDTTPEISGEPATEVLQDIAYLFMPVLNYLGDDSQVSFLIENKPEWAIFSAETGELSGVPSNEDIGEFQQIFISSTNGYVTDELAPFSIEVINVNDAPVQSKAISSGDTSFTVDTDITVDFSQYFSDVDMNDELTFSADDLPVELTLNEQGLLTGTVTSVGAIPFILLVTDIQGESISQELTLQISQAPTIEKPEKKSSSGGGNVYYLIGLMLLVISRQKSQ